MNGAGQPMLADKNLALFFSLGYSLKTWHEAGILEREINPYNRMAKSLRTIYLISYGDQTDLEYQERLEANVRLAIRNFALPPVLYAMAAPFLHRAILRKVDLFKTLQISGAWSALPAKLIFRKPLSIRCGYQQSLNHRRKISATTGRLRAIFLVLYIINTLLEWAAYHAADLIILASESDRRYVLSRYRVNPAKIKMLPNAIDTNLFCPMPNIRRERRRVCFVGRLVPEKNLLNLLNAVKGLNVELVIFGDGFLRDALQKHAADKDIHNVVFRGLVPNSDLPTEFNRSDVSLLVSNFEGNPKALLEAMSCGLPVIGSDVEGIREIITHEENGYLCSTTAEDIRNAIQTVLGDQALMIKMGKQARSTILDHYSIDELLAKELELLRSLLQ